MPDPRLERITAKLPAGLRLNPPLTEAQVAAFEADHGVTLPEEYRLFVTRLGDGDNDRVLRLADTDPAGLNRPSPYLPGPRYQGDWEQRHEEPPGPRRTFLPGTLTIAGHGCSLYTHLVVSGPARGRLFNVDVDGPAGPYILEDSGFLAWYERWIDETAAGFDVGWFGENLPLPEPDLLTVLAEDPAAHRRARAGETLLRLPVVSGAVRAAVDRAARSDRDPQVRADLLQVLGRWNDEAARIELAAYARSVDPPGLRALSWCDRLGLDDILPELAHPDRERRRVAAYELAWNLGGLEPVAAEALDPVARRLLRDPDPLLRCHGVALVWRRGLVHLHPLLDEMGTSETEPWVRFEIAWCLSRGAVAPSGSDVLSGPWAATPPRMVADEPPF
ncbi:SMI1/KNR4 family protein [Actinoplanes utahensis]|uniref:Knr4/Smi1-like domain-containing protein n=1 Tax=Actinoplanes utahensis TaxID=1869 RepID=A0A0A6UL33_ACTUT|nr:SMI1/KNR4 family protein [Actinoplanes utahensis]KHD75029.1 hypothetical protein MB27_24950 [Actinoplanes utahensis]GIF28428.1 hypothetical protein Aut01nite_14140 [Actinoplanes utahensis]